MDNAFKISYIIGLLRDRALSWSESKYTDPNIVNPSFQNFISDFEQTFGCKNIEMTCKLWSLKRWHKSVSEFAIDFRALAASSEWNAKALKGTFIKTLNKQLKDHLAYRYDPTMLEELIALAICLDNHINKRARNRRHECSFVDVISGPPLSFSQPSSFMSFPTVEPMQIGRARLTTEERQCRMEVWVCIYCGKLDTSLQPVQLAQKGRSNGRKEGKN